MDDIILNWCQTHQNSVLILFLKDITYVGTYPVLSFLLAFCVGYLAKQKEYHRAAVAVSVIFCSCFLIEMVKVAVRRDRPEGHFERIQEFTDYSFPSIGAGASMVVFLVLAQAMDVIGQRRFLIVSGIILSIIVGLGRVYLGFVYFSDAICGWLLGLISGLIYMLLTPYMSTKSVSRRSTDPQPTDSSVRLGLYLPSKHGRSRQFWEQ